MADHTDPPADSDTPSAPISPLVVLSRRWPLMVVGIVAGLAFGVLIQLSSTRIYQSNAQLLVVKRRADVANAIERGGAVDDYVGAQITIIKSEQVRRAAAKELRKKQVSAPLPEEDGILANKIGDGLSVVRDRESAGTIGSGIVLLSMKGINPADTKLYLEAVVTAYQNVLTGVYDTTARKEIELAKNSIKADQAKQQQLGEEKIKKENEKNAITVEDVEGVRARLTSQKDSLYKLQLEIVQVDEDLKLIAQAGPNQGLRNEVYAQLTGEIKATTSRGGDLGAESQLRAKKQLRESLLEKLGPDHPDIHVLDGEIRYLSDEIARLNPTNPSGVLDPLAAMGLQLKKRQLVVREQIKQLEARINTDQKNLVDVGQIRTKLDGIEANLKVIVENIAKLEQQVRTAEVAVGAGGYEANAVTPPAHGHQVAPVLAQSLMLGIAAGLALGGVAVALAELTDRSFKSPAEIRRRLGVPVIGHIPQIKGVDQDSPEGMRGSIVCALRPKSMEAEAYRGVRTQLYFSTQGRGHQVIQITSPNPGDGKSTLAANLAVSIAQSGKPTVLIDCDFRKPRVHKIFGLEGVETGVSSVVAGGATVAKALRRSPIENLDLMPCGPRPENPAELLTHPRFAELLAELRERYDFVIVDTPPILAVTDPSAVAPQVDGVIMVFKMDKNARPFAERTREQLGAVGANVLGVVVNGSSAGGSIYAAYNYGTNYGYKYKAYEYAEGYADEDTPSLPAGARG